MSLLDPAWHVKYTRSLYGILGLFIVLAVLAPQLLGSVHNNIGTLTLIRALTQGDVTAASEAAVRAEALFRRSVEHNPRSRLAWRTLGYALIAQGKEAQAVLAWREAEDMAPVLIDRATRLEAAGRLQEAVILYQRAALVEPESVAPWYKLGLAYERMGDWEQAAAAYRQGLQRSGTDSLYLSDLLFRLGWILQRQFARRDAEEILELYSRALEIDSFHSDWAKVHSHYARGEMLRELGRDREAMKEYQWVLAHRSSDYWAHVHLGVLKWQVDRNASEAIRHLERAIEIDDEEKWAYRGLGLVHQATGQRQEAVEAYCQVLALDPLDSVADQRLKEMHAEHECK